MSLAERFHRLYQGLDRAHGRFDVSGRSRTRDGKIEGKARTLQAPVTAELFRQHLEGEAGLGIVPINDDGTCYFGVIDVDNYGLDFSALCEKVMDMNLPLIPIRSKSGGAHLTVFFSEAISARTVRSTLQEWAIALGYPGSIEIFPKQNALASDEDTGNWINMPYFNHLETDRFAFIHGKQATATQFANWAEQNRINLDTLEGITPQVESAFDDGPPCLQQLSIHGFPEGGRNNALFNIGVYLRQKHEDDWEDYLDEMNQNLMDPPLPSREVQTIAKSLKKKDYFYRCKEQPIQPACNHALCLKRQFGVGQSADHVSVEIGTLSKHLTDPPLWFLDVDGERIDLTTDELFSFDRFRKKCCERLNKLPEKVRPNVWERTIADRLEKLVEVEAPFDASPAGQLVEHLHRFLKDTSVSGDAKALDAGKPYRKGNLVYFRGTDFQRYLKAESFTMPETRVWQTLKDHAGLQHGQVWIKLEEGSKRGKNITAWFIEVEADDEQHPGEAWDDTEF